MLLSQEILAWIKYPGEGAEPLHYRIITKPMHEFNKSIREIYTGTPNLELAKVEATQIFHHSHRSLKDTSYMKKRAIADLPQAQRLCDLAKALAEVFTKTPKLCQSDHLAHIHLSGFGENHIDTFVSLGGETKPKWHIVHWVKLNP